MLILLVVVEVNNLICSLGEVGAAQQKRNNRAEQDRRPSAMRLLLLLDGLVKSVVEIISACWIQEQYVCVTS